MTCARSTDVVKACIILRNISNTFSVNIIYSFEKINTFVVLYKILIVNLEKCSKGLSRDHLSSGGYPGDGDGTQGTCDSGKFCYANMICSDKCSKTAVNGVPGDGDGVSKGNCPGENEICNTEGICEGTYYHNEHIRGIGNCYFLYYSLNSFRIL